MNFETGFHSSTLELLNGHGFVSVFHNDRLDAVFGQSCCLFWFFPIIQGEQQVSTLK
jgi:hypothetical protein